MKVGDLVKHHHDHLTGNVNLGVVINIESLKANRLGIEVLWSKPRLDSLIRKFPMDQLEVVYEAR